MFSRIWYRSQIRCGRESKGSCGLVGRLFFFFHSVLDWYAVGTRFQFSLVSLSTRGSGPQLLLTPLILSYCYTRHTVTSAFKTALLNTIKLVNE